MVRKHSVSVVNVAAFTLTLCIVIALANSAPARNGDILRQMFDYEDAGFKRASPMDGYPNESANGLSPEQVIKLLDRIGKK